MFPDFMMFLKSMADAYGFPIHSNRFAPIVVTGGSSLALAVYNFPVVLKTVGIAGALKVVTHY
jgi:hypothetical protein